MTGALAHHLIAKALVVIVGIGGIGLSNINVLQHLEDVEDPGVLLLPLQGFNGPSITFVFSIAADQMVFA